MKSSPKITRRRLARPHLTPGVPPGSLSPIPGSAPARVTLLAIDQGAASAPRLLDDLADLPVPGGGACHWVRVTGLGDLAPLRAISDFYGLQSMTLEDILNRGWRSKLERSGQFTFLALQAPPDGRPDAGNEHISLLYKTGLIISFENAPTTLIDTLWQRLAAARAASMPLKREAEAYLAYAVMDLVIDRFFPLLYMKDEMLAELEDITSVRVPTREEMNKLYTIKRNLLSLRHLLSPYRELEAAFRQVNADQKYAELRPYLSDLRDNVTQAAELLDAYRDIADSLYDICQSTLTNHLNDIIKVLTIISTIFMPLTFIAGIYGMNFEDMPELRSSFGYPAVLSGMLLIVAGMLWFFRKKKWL